MAEEHDEVKLLGAAYSPFVYRVIWVLKMKGIEYEYLNQDTINKSSLLLETNPVHKKVPVLLHNAKPISESLIIIEYLDDTWKNNPILPQDPYQRAMARFWAKFAEDKVIEVIRKVLLLGEKEQEKEVKEAREAMEILEGELKGKKFFGGETVGLLDIVMGVMVEWVGAIEEVACVEVFDSLKYPSLNRWMEDFSELPVIKKNLPVRDHLVATFHKIRQIGLSRTATE